MKVWVCKECTKPCILITHDSSKPTACPYDFNVPKWVESLMVCEKVIRVRNLTLKRFKLEV